jgi:hypothetical protein
VSLGKSTGEQLQNFLQAEQLQRFFASLHYAQNDNDIGV